MTSKIREALERYVAKDDSARFEILHFAEQLLLAKLERQGLVSDPSVAGQMFRLRLANLEREEFHVMFLDTRHRVLAVEMLFVGTIDGAEVHPREVVKRALHYNAAAVILAHNHPSGESEPSAADRATTARLKQALALVDIRMLDHFVVSASSATSMAARGWV